MNYLIVGNPVTPLSVQICLLTVQSMAAILTFGFDSRASAASMYAFDSIHHPLNLSPGLNALQWPHPETCQLDHMETHMERRTSRWSRTSCFLSSSQMILRSNGPL